MVRHINENDWIVTEEGIGQVISMYDRYVEKFSPSFLNSEKRLGEFDFKVCKYKLFMNFDGKIRKRSAIFTTNINYCEELSEKYQKLRDEVLEHNREAFEKFLNLKVNIPLTVNFELFFRNESGINLDVMKGDIKEISASLSKPFGFEEFLRFVDNKGLEIDLDKANKNPNLTAPDFYIRLHNENYATRNKTLLFKKVELIINN